MSDKNPILYNDDVIGYDPRIIATGGQKGAIIKFAPLLGSPVFLQKQDHGITTNWAEVGGGGGAVTSVNGQTGVVVLNASDVGADPAGAAAAAIAAHVAAPDPHPQYLTAAEGSASFDPLGAAAAEIAAHVAAPDPHPQYLTAAEGASFFDPLGAAASVQSNLTAHVSDTGNPHATTKAQVGLGNVDDTSDATKNSAVATLTNKSISGATNTLSDIPVAALVPGAENQQLKVVSGVATWSTMFLEFFGGVSSGNLNIVGPLTLTDDIFVNILTIGPGAILNTNGWRIFCKTLDLSNAPANSIRRNGTSGANAVGQTGGGTTAALNAQTLGGSGSGGSGGTGVVGVGPQGATGSSQVNSNGGGSGASGQGGSGTPNAGGAGRAANTTAQGVTFDRIAYDFFRAAVQIGAGAGGPGGAAGGGDGVNLGRGGGAGASGAAVLAIYAHTIITSALTPAGVIACVGGNGGNGASATVGNVGGGGGGGASGGGYAYIMYANRTGPVVANLIAASGGLGGSGGNGFGTGTGGRGGGGGNGGRIQLFNITTATGSLTVGLVGTAGAANAGLIGDRKSVV